MNSEYDHQGNLKLTFPTGTVVVIPERQVLLHQRDQRCQQAAADAIRAVLADEPSCGQSCGEHYHKCGCLQCAEQNGYFEPGEKETFTQEQQALIGSCWYSETGFLGESGCRLPRSCRPMACLRNICEFDTNLKKYQDHYR
jgi:hypothetical protein